MTPAQVVTVVVVYGAFMVASFLALLVVHSCTISALVAHSGIYYHYLGIISDGGVAIIVENAAGVEQFGLRIMDSAGAMAKLRFSVRS